MKQARKYRTVVIDPPWDYPEGWPGWGTRRSLPYPSLTVEQIRALPVAELLEREGYLFLWSTDRYLEDAFGLIRSWGCTRRQTVTWCKNPNGEGPGGMFASTTEFLLIAQKIREGTNAHGRRTTGKRFDSSWFNFKRGRHSRKPDEFMRMIEAASLPPYLEMFARERREGWDAWGNEVRSDFHIPVVGLLFDKSLPAPAPSPDTTRMRPDRTDV